LALKNPADNDTSDNKDKKIKFFWFSTMHGTKYPKLLDRDNVMYMRKTNVGIFVSKILK
jgi:hypothetical protein